MLGQDGHKKLGATHCTEYTGFNTKIWRTCLQGGALFVLEDGARYILQWLEASILLPKAHLTFVEAASLSWRERQLEDGVKYTWLSPFRWSTGWRIPIRGHNFQLSDRAGNTRHSLEATIPQLEDRMRGTLMEASIPQLGDRVGYTWHS